ncbi:MAG: tyrosine-type recombinase/integrase [Bdellovibrionales bacterium]
MKTTDSSFLKEISLLFLHYMLYTKKVSPHTLKAYENDLKDFFDEDKSWGSLHFESSKPPLKKINKKNLEKIIKHSIEKKTNRWSKLSSSSKGRKLATMRSFIKWLVENQYLEIDFRHLFKSPKLAIKIPNFLSVDEALFLKKTLLKEKEKEKNSKTIDRDLALFFLLYGGGLRVSEACHLKTKNIDFDHKILKIKGKGNKERVVAIPQEAMDYLKPLQNNFPYLFGKTALLERKAYNIIRDLGKKAGLLKPLHPHALRHSFATHLLSGGSDLRVLQELLGHKTLTATQKYTHLDLAQLSQTLEKFHPISSRKS